MKEYTLNDSEQVRTDAINLVDNLTEYTDSGNDEAANELFRDFIRHLVVNGFITDHMDGLDEYTRTFSGLNADNLYSISPSVFSYQLIKYCFADVPDIHHRIDLDFPNWKFTMEVLMNYFT